MKVDVVSVLVFLFSAQVEAGVGGLNQVPGRDPQLSLQKKHSPSCQLSPLSSVPLSKGHRDCYSEADSQKPDSS
jgi:hypothetical protein